MAVPAERAMGARAEPGRPERLLRAARGRFRGLLRRRGDEASGVGLRLLVSFLLSLVLLGAAGYWLMGKELYHAQITSRAAAQRADAVGFQDLGRQALSRAAVIREIDEVIDAVGRRPGTLEAILVDSQNIVRAAADDRVVGSREADPPLDAALQAGIEYAGYEQVPGADHRDFEFIVPVELPWGRYAYEVTYDHSAFDQELGSVRRVLGLIGLFTIVGAAGLFYLVGGRSFLRSHRFALRRATHDGLTDLPNQRAFHDELGRAVATAVRYKEPLALAILDVDDFKFTNDRHGHPHGDRILKRVAAILRQGRIGDRAYRIGGDEFALLLPHTDAAGVRVFGRRLSRTINADGLRVSIGVSTLQAGRQADVLQAEADAALYEAKRHGGNQVVYFNDIHEHVVVTSSSQRDALRRLIEERGVTTVYQPIWDFEAGRLLGVEALSRPDPGYELSGPQEAFDIAEQIGRVHDLDTVCATAALSIAPVLPPDTLLFLNISPQTLDLDADGDEWLRAAVDQAGLPYSRVVIEVTERFDGRTAAVSKCLHRLRSHGFKVALDDVGTGNSGLEVLRNIDAEYVKIDGSIVSAATTDPNARAVLMAMATYARQTGAYVIAESIEDDETLHFLRGIDDRQIQPHKIIQGGQGYSLGYPARTIQTQPPAPLELAQPAA
jgi:diguanylate cyclase (GGDEF)-like protein